MSSLVYLILLTSAFTIMQCEKPCSKEYQSMNGTVVNLKDYCKEKLCIVKCCNKSEIFYNNLSNGRQTCNSTNGLPRRIIANLNNIKMFKKTIKEKVEIIKKSKNNFRFITDLRINCADMDRQQQHSTMNVYLIENGHLMTELLPNYYDPWIEWPEHSFCMDQGIDIENGQVIGDPYLFYFTFRPVAPESLEFYQQDKYRSIYAGFGCLISCIFMLMVLIVYALLPELRSLGGLMLMASVGTQFVFFLVVAIDSIGSWINTNRCTETKYLKYFTMLSTIFWMTMNAFEIWRFVTHSNGKTAERKVMKMFLYGLFAWGIPALMTVGIIIVDDMDLSHIPRFIKPHMKLSCFFGDTGSRMLYLYVPMLILIAFNMLFFILTVIHIVRIDSQMKQMNTLDSNCNKRNKSRLFSYVKLSVVMGLSWIFEVIIVYVPSDQCWFKYVCDTYNMLSGVAIFFLFVFRKNVLHMMRYRFLRCGVESLRSGQNSSSSKTTEENHYVTPTF